MINHPQSLILLLQGLRLPPQQPSNLESVGWWFPGSFPDTQWAIPSWAFLSLGLDCTSTSCHTYAPLSPVIESSLPAIWWLSQLQNPIWEILGPPLGTICCRSVSLACSFWDEGLIGVHPGWEGGWKTWDEAEEGERQDSRSKDFSWSPRVLGTRIAC